MSKDLERFFNPRSIALVGASQDFTTISGQPLQFLKLHHFRGELYPVNPKYQEILGVKCYASLDALPETPDLVLILISAARVADIVRQCGKLGVPYVIIFSSGYAEVGGDGVKLQQELAAIVRELDVGIVGPNCQGMMNVADGVYVGFGSVFYDDYTPGAVSMVSQSGGFGFGVMNLSAKDSGLDFRQIVTTGNEIGVSSLDFIDYFIDDEKTDIIVCYIEGLRDAYRLIDVGARALRKKKPILAWKVGNTEHGRKAAAAHTANLGGTMALYKAAFRQAGIIQVKDIQDVADYARAFQCGKLPAGNRVAIITISGGAGILMTDECIECGMQMAQLAPATTEKLRRIVPSFGSLLNPVDITAAIHGDLSMIRRTLHVILDDPGVDSIAMMNGSLQGELAARLGTEIAAVVEQTEKPIFVAWAARDEVAQQAYAKLDEVSVPHYRSPVRCARALAVLSWYAGALRRNELHRAETVPALSSSEARQALEGRRDDVSEYAAKKILACYGIGSTQEELAASGAQAVAIANKMGYPVALKVQSPDIPHKTESKAVRLNLASDAEVTAAYEEILRNAKAYKAAARIEGVLVQEMVTGGIEAILGVTNDELFGPAVMFGLGGVFAEVLKDVAFRIAPVTKSVALDMIAEIKGYEVLTGARGAPHADIEAVADAIVRVSALALDLRDCVAEIDINPLFVFPKGKGVKAGDALIRPRQASN